MVIDMAIDDEVGGNNNDGIWRHSVKMSSSGGKSGIKEPDYSGINILRIKPDLLYQVPSF
ncbi:8994_t:CDS:2 [Funneliformis geosporum]|uniref:8994_t:CDS:1 n=1 Tax=Funneliformis geosporum TaxID=1117311 RepID=A0A9W4SDU4_9GLOM|nr:8994_t:CDS:2 [Funneliformis geosporum]